MTFDEADLEDVLGPPPVKTLRVKEAPAQGAPVDAALPWPLGLSDDELHRAEAEAATNATSRQVKFAQEMAAGASVIDAAKRASMSMKSASPWKTAKRMAVLRLVAILREQARRRAHLTVEMAVQEFRALGDEARAAGDFSAATRAKREAALLLGLYPETRLKLQLEAPAIEPRSISPEEWMELARLRHVVRPGLPQTVDALPASGLDSGLHASNPMPVDASANPLRTLGDKEGDNDA